MIDSLWKSVGLAIGAAGAIGAGFKFKQVVARATAALVPLRFRSNIKNLYFDKLWGWCQAWPEASEWVLKSFITSKPMQLSDQLLEDYHIQYYAGYSALPPNKFSIMEAIQAGVCV